jgi:hypothetical protein
MADPNHAGSDHHTHTGSRAKGPILIAATAVWYAALVVIAVIIVPTQVERQAIALVSLVILALAPVAILLAAITARAIGSSSAESRLDRITHAVESFSQEQGLSEGAKRVLHRRQERELLRRAIEQDILAQDWDAAMVLVKELAERFGYRADAEEFRTRIERARTQNLDRMVVDALTHLDDVIRARQWADAYAEAARIERLYPDSHRVDNLRHRVDEARRKYRKELERRFLQSAEHQRIDEAMELLKELDQYLTRAEADQFQEVARGVISKSRENLGVRFKILVQDHMWSDAIAVGQQIIDEFPNTRMATEVRDLLPELRNRASGKGTPAAQTG